MTDPQEIQSAGSTNFRLDSRGGISGEVYCPVCGRDVDDRSLERFGQYFCSEAHVAEFAQEVRSRQASGAAAIAAPGTEVDAAQASGIPQAASAPQKMGGIGGFLKMAACCGGMLLLLPALGLVSAGGIVAVAGSALTVAAALACPLGMYFMMRAMMKGGNQGAPRPQGELQARPKALPPDTTGKSQ